MSTRVDADNAAIQDAQTEARAIARCVRGCATDDQYIELVERIATALAAKDAELAEAVSALWRIPPNTHTIPCEANGFVEPDPFEGAGETYADAYTREKSRAKRAEAALAERAGGVKVKLDTLEAIFWRRGVYNNRSVCRQMAEEVLSALTTEPAAPEGQQET